MIFRRIALALAAAACLATAAAIALIALAFALYAALVDRIGAPLAACCVFAAAAIIVGVAALVLITAAKPGGRKARGHGGGAQGHLADAIADLVRERPLAASAVAAVAGWVLTRSPALAGVVSTLISRQARDRRD